MSLPGKIVVGAIWLYRKLVSPLIPNRCRYYPSCSSYALGAVRRYGVLRGTVIAAWRVIKCNPLSDGGVDLVEDQRVFGERLAPRKMMAGRR